MLVPQKYSERLGVIEPDQLRQAAHEWDLGEVVDAYSPTASPLGQNIVLETTNGRYVLRGNPRGHVQLTKERRVAAFVHERSSLAVPWPYEICEDATVFGWTYAILPWLPGAPGAELWPMLDDGGRVALAASAGEALARLHEAESDFFGPYDAQLDGFIEMDDFADWFLYRLEHWRNACRAVQALSTDGEHLIDDVVDRCADALDEPFTPVLVHHDFTLDNLNFNPGAVFDLSEAYLSDGEEDLVRMLRSVESDEQRTAFVGAYTRSRPLRPGAAERLTLYALADWLVAWHDRRRAGIALDDASFVDAVRPILETAGRVS